MKLATFRHGAGPELGVVIDGERIVPLSRLAPRLAADMIDLISNWKDVEGETRRVAAEATETLALADVKLLAPVPRPSKIMAIGLNYADHIAETGAQTPANQIWFSKQINAVTGPFDP